MDSLRLTFWSYDIFEWATEIASIMNVDVIYAMKHVINSREMLRIGPNLTKPSGYVNGPVASKRLITVAEA